jgi:Fe2+ or Zn2+ uptake regulation protein|uniref:Putative transcriptional regulator, Fur family n=1 Tax=uncultured bacterium Contig1625 TaxID=1393476 RepID=W0FKG1_9BACT|nr:putative transcriptional regulator, Fur family [uncultured bacterium Contig1625]
MNKNADLILKTVLQSSAHMTAEEIHAALRDSGHRMALATVYNNLAQLHSEGRIRKVCVEGHPDRYDKMIRHDHLVCRRCGKLTDICFQDLTKLLQSQTDEELLSYDLQVSYICPACRRTAHPASTTDP